MTKETAKQAVHGWHPHARECVRLGSRLVYIVIGLGTVLGEGTTAFLAWRNAAWNLSVAKTDK